MIVYALVSDELNNGMYQLSYEISYVVKNGWREREEITDPLPLNTYLISH